MSRNLGAQGWNTVRIAVMGVIIIVLVVFALWVIPVSALAPGSPGSQAIADVTVTISATYQYQVVSRNLINLQVSATTSNYHIPTLLGHSIFDSLLGYDIFPTTVTVTVTFNGQTQTQNVNVPPLTFGNYPFTNTFVFHDVISGQTYPGTVNVATSCGPLGGCGTTTATFQVSV